MEDSGSGCLRHYPSIILKGMRKSIKNLSIVVFYVVTPCRLFGGVPTFRRNILPPSSAQRINIFTAMSTSDLIKVYKNHQSGQSVPRREWNPGSSR
jgi:hypothetical protein